MALDSRTRSALVAQSHSLRPAVTLSAEQLSEASIAQVRDALRGRRLLKVRVQADSAAECDAAVEQLATEVPCELVKRVGRVVILFREIEESNQ